MLLLLTDERETLAPASRLFYNSIGIKDALLYNRDDSNNNILHLAAKLAPASRFNSVSGTALQM
jgi:hypothetical protein